jgi:hypothetical protein
LIVDSRHVRLAGLFGCLAPGEEIAGLGLAGFFVQVALPADLLKARRRCFANGSARVCR